MKRAFFASAIAIALSAQIYADVTIKSTGSGKGMGMSATMATTTYIKGMKQRIDSVNGDKTTSTIFDVENQKMYMFDSKKKEADVFDMAAVAEEMGKSVTIGDMKSSIKPNGQTKQVAGKTANGYDVSITVPAMIGGEKGMQVTINLTGPVWIVKGAPGTADYAAFYKAAAERGFIFSDPRAAKGSPGQAKAMAEMYAEHAKLGGVPYESVMNIKLDADGPMGGMMEKMGGMSASNVVQSIETGPLPDSMFLPPAGYKLNAKK